MHLEDAVLQMMMSGNLACLKSSNASAKSCMRRACGIICKVGKKCVYNEGECGRIITSL